MDYTKLWMMLIDLNMNKDDLAKRTGLSKSTINKLSHNKNVYTDVLICICKTLCCQLNEIVELKEN